MALQYKNFGDVNPIEHGGLFIAKESENLLDLDFHVIEVSKFDDEDDRWLVQQSSINMQDVSTEELCEVSNEFREEFGKIGFKYDDYVACVIRHFGHTKYSDPDTRIIEDKNELIEYLTDCGITIPTYTAHYDGKMGENIYAFSRVDFAFPVTVVKEISFNTIEDIIVNGFEGGIGYWCSHVKDTFDDGTPIREGKPKDMPLSQWCTHLILTGQSVPLKVIDEESTYYLTKEGLIKGFTKHMQNNPDLAFDGDADSGDADIIIQIALFGDVIYG